MNVLCSSTHRKGDTHRNPEVKLFRGKLLALHCVLPLIGCFAKALFETFLKSDCVHKVYDLNGFVFAVGAEFMIHNAVIIYALLFSAQIHL